MGAAGSPYPREQRVRVVLLDGPAERAPAHARSDRRPLVDAGERGRGRLDWRSTPGRTRRVVSVLQRQVVRDRAAGGHLKTSAKAVMIAADSSPTRSRNLSLSISTTYLLRLPPFSSQARHLWVSESRWTSALPHSWHVSGSLTDSPPPAGCEPRRPRRGRRRRAAPTHRRRSRPATTAPRGAAGRA